jgi:hypothetical protein
MQESTTDASANATHDLKLTWAFMSSGFLESRFQRYFPPTSGSPQTLDHAPYPIPLYPGEPTRNLDTVLKETLTQLSRPPGVSHLTSPVPGNDSLATHLDSFESFEASIEQDTDLDIVLESPDSSPRKQAVEEVEVERHWEDEPKVWAETLRAGCEELVKVAVGREDCVGVQSNPGDNGPLSCRRVIGEVCLDSGGVSELIIFRIRGQHISRQRMEESSSVSEGYGR